MKQKKRGFSSFLSFLVNSLYLAPHRIKFPLFFHSHKSEPSVTYPQILHSILFISIDTGLKVRGLANHVNLPQGVSTSVNTYIMGRYLHGCPSYYHTIALSVSSFDWPEVVQNVHIYCICMFISWWHACLTYAIWYVGSSTKRAIIEYISHNNLCM